MANIDSIYRLYDISLHHYSIHSRHVVLGLVRDARIISNMLCASPVLPLAVRPQKSLCP